MYSCFLRFVVPKKFHAIISHAKARLLDNKYHESVLLNCMMTSELRLITLHEGT